LLGNEFPRQDVRYGAVERYSDTWVGFYRLKTFGGIDGRIAAVGC